MVRYEYFVGIISVFSTFSNFFKKKEIIKAIFGNFSMRLIKYFLKKFKICFAPQNIKKPASKVAHNPTRPSVWLCGTETVF